MSVVRLDKPHSVVVGAMRANVFPMATGPSDHQLIELLFSGDVKGLMHIPNRWYPSAVVDPYKPTDYFDVVGAWKGYVAHILGESDWVVDMACVCTNCRFCFRRRSSESLYFPLSETSFFYQASMAKDCHAPGFPSSYMSAAALMKVAMVTDFFLFMKKTGAALVSKMHGVSEIDDYRLPRITLHDVIMSDMYMDTGNAIRTRHHMLTEDRELLETDFNGNMMDDVTIRVPEVIDLEERSIFRVSDDEESFESMESVDGSDDSLTGTVDSDDAALMRFQFLRAFGAYPDVSRMTTLPTLRSHVRMYEEDSDETSDSQEQEESGPEFIELLESDSDSESEPQGNIPG